MTEELNQALNDALELIERREKLLDEIDGYSEAEAYLSRVPLAYRDYKRSYIPRLKLWQALRNIDIFCIFIILLTTNNYISVELIYLFIVEVACASICYCLPRGYYNVYIINDKLKREPYEKQMPRLNELRDQLDSLEAFMNVEQNCIIPQEHWRQAHEIVSYIRRGRAKSVEEAIDLIEKNIKALQVKALQAQDAK